MNVFKSFRYRGVSSTRGTLSLVKLNKKTCSKVTQHSLVSLNNLCSFEVCKRTNLDYKRNC